MPEFTASFQYLTPTSAVSQEDDCRIQFDAQSLTVVPAAHAPTAMDLADLEAVVAQNYQVRLPLYTGYTLVLRQLGRAYERFAQDLLAAYRERALQCLLLEDMQEIARFPGAFEVAAAALMCPGCGTRTHGKFCPQCGRPVAAKTPSPAMAGASSGEAEIRVYKSNVAVLPSASQPFHVRLGAVDGVQFAPGSFEVVLETVEQSVKFRQLGKRTEEFARKIRDAVSALGGSTAQAIHLALPFLNPDEVQRVAVLLRDGRSASISRLSAIHARIPAALASNAVDADLKPYYDELVRLTLPESQYAGFKLIRAEDGADTSPAGESGESIADADAAAPETLYWFFFPLATSAGGSEPANLMAWEAISRSGRATYFFRMVDPAECAALKDAGRAAGMIESAVTRLNTALAALNFRRRPIYLSEDELQQNPTFHRYAIAARRIPEVRQLRASFVGRAMHGSLDSWREQVAAILAKSAPAAGSAC